MEINLKGKKALIAGIADQHGFGWAIAKGLADAGAEIIALTWPPVYKIFTTSLESGKLEEARALKGGGTLSFAKIYPFDAVFDTPEQVPAEIAENKRYKGLSGYTVSEVAHKVEKDFGKVDLLVHSLANGPEVGKPLLETSRHGYLAALGASAFSNISLLQHFGPLLNPESAALSLTYMASEKAVPGYGGGMSSAKAALESDTRTLAWEAARKWGVRINTISAGPLPSRAAKAIGFIDQMIEYSKDNAPLQRKLKAEEVGNAAAFLLSPLASAITGSTIYVDLGMHAMGVAMNRSLS